MTGTWGYYVQGNGQQLEEDELGAILNLKINCAVHYPAYNKPLYECLCGITFPLSIVQHCRKINDWSYVQEKHNTLGTITVNKPKCIGPTTMTEEQTFWKGQVAMRKAAGDM